MAYPLCRHSELKSLRERCSWLGGASDYRHVVSQKIWKSSLVILFTIKILLIFIFL
ncbi:hypothetical protein BQ8482_420004 [Mesorhizobium delmotii]|uniref:Uncharacterized protein n=1 Tax=Mesorhizobium delmotii TaxID=1631247 RepID=A0A2P9AT79_9HYPH|nr:hypothetical protein BQ8482_420004 [Mesorhizobium delmotii]